MKNIFRKFMEFHNNERGDIVQTGIILGILAVVAVGALLFLQPKIKAMFNKTGDALDQGNATSY